MPSGRHVNKTAPVPGEILQPVLATALHLVTVVGPHGVAFQRQIREAGRVSSLKAEGPRHSAPTAIEDIKAVLAGYIAASAALPMIENHDIGPRLAAGWAADDPLLPVATGVLARQAGYAQLWSSWMPLLRGPLQDAVNSVGVDRQFARNAAETPAADGSGMLPWTLPLHRSRAVALVGIVRPAAIVLLAAVSGMRPASSWNCASAADARRRNRSPDCGGSGSPAGSSRDSPWAAPTMSGASSSPPARPWNSPSSCTTTRNPAHRCSAGSPSTSVTDGSAHGGQFRCGPLAGTGPDPRFLCVRSVRKTRSS
jgi:hypothetical protein